MVHFPPGVLPLGRINQGIDISIELNIHMYVHYKIDLSFVSHLFAWSPVPNCKGKVFFTSNPVYYDPPFYGFFCPKSYILFIFLYNCLITTICTLSLSPPPISKKSKFFQPPSLILIGPPEIRNRRVTFYISI